jgi:hypothetical protein
MGVSNGSGLQEGAVWRDTLYSFIPEVWASASPPKLFTEFYSKFKKHGMAKERENLPLVFLKA